jgi:tellurite resistance protein TerC
MYFLADAATAATVASTLPPLGFPLVDVVIFAAAVIFSIAVDLFLHKDSKEISLGNAAIWSVFWIALSLGYYAYIYFCHGDHGPEYASLFLAGYAMEKVLSIDNLMLFMAVFSYFKIEGALQHRILYWGIIGAIVFRGVFVAAGSLLLYFAGWADLLFGLFVIWSGIAMLKEALKPDAEEDDEEENYNEYQIVKIARRFFPVFPRLDGHHFFISRKRADELSDEETRASFPANAATFMTPAFVCLLVIEASDILFAFDSVPAVIAISREPLIVYASMIFAILGLRSLYFVLAALTKYLIHLDKAVIGLLFFIGFKMLVHAFVKLGEKFNMNVDFLHQLEISPNMSLLVILVVLTLGVIASAVFPSKKHA